eukprot:scaffold87041_cov18-Tisochrysis_lutea.AAC.2
MPEFEVWHEQTSKQLRLHKWEKAVAGRSIAPNTPCPALTCTCVPLYVDLPKKVDVSMCVCATASASCACSGSGPCFSSILFKHCCSQAA